jgi:hypothetical protein
MENRYIQLMILLAAGEVDSCKFNAKRLFDKVDKIGREGDEFSRITKNNFSK